MIPPEDIAARLPAPRDDEPESLRTDVVDELADHLACAFQRELHRTTDTEQARQSVLARFGDPVRVARRLWWDAMREKTMNQRITAIAAGVAAAACLVACGLIWQMLEQSRQQQAALLDGQREANSQLVDQLSAMMAGQQQASEELIAAIADGESEAASDAAWQPLRIRLVDDTGQPVSASVSVRGTAMSGGSLNERAETDADGVADFGRLPPGEYRAIYSLSLRDQQISSFTEFLLGPGRTNEIEVICPSGPPGTFPVVFDIQPPEALANIPLFYFAELRYESREFDGQQWDVSYAEKTVLLLDAVGSILGQANYHDITYHEDVRGFVSTNYIEQLPPDFPLQAVDELPAYVFGVDLWAFVEDPAAAEPDGEGRPALKRLTGAALRDLPNVQPTAGEEHRVLVDASRTPFWNDMRNDLERMERYRELSAADEDAPAVIPLPDVVDE